MSMKFEFDPKKDAANRKKHGLSLGLAAELDWNAMVTRVDDGHGEERWFGIAPSAGQLYSVVFTVREEQQGRQIDEVVRPISLRRATKPEEQDYGKKTRKR
jgi:uncharacterized protein